MCYCGGVWYIRTPGDKHGSPAAGGCANEGCDNDGACKRRLGLLTSLNRPRSDCRGCATGCVPKRGGVEKGCANA